MTAEIAVAVATIVAAIGAVITAVVTAGLWRVTAVLARETTRMADATGQPQVVATLRPNPWAINHTDLTVQNCGNAAAFDIHVSFDPPLLTDRNDLKARARPFQQVSVLRPGEALTSRIGDSNPLTEQAFSITTRWRRSPTATETESLTYTHGLGDVVGMSQLGGDALIEIAKQVKRLREDWQYVASGNRRVSADTFNAVDRREEQDALERRFADQDRQLPSDQA